MKTLRSLLLCTAALLLATSLAATPAAPEVTPAASPDAAALFAPAGCPEASSASQPLFASETWSCGTCGHPACSGASIGAYCGRRYNTSTLRYEDMFCQANQLCSGEGIGKRRCLCVVDGDIIP